MKHSMFESWKKYQVKADSVEDFLHRYYKPIRYTGRGADYAAILLESYRNDVNKQGFCIISHHDNVTGEVVAYYPDN